MKTKDTPKQYVIYSRKSKFTGKGESIENQIELCRQYIAMHFGEKAAENVLVYEDEGFSGGNLERLQFKKNDEGLPRRSPLPPSWSTASTVSAATSATLPSSSRIWVTGIDFISIREQFDTSSPMGRAMMYIASVFSQLSGRPLPSASGTICTSCPRPGAGWAAQRPRAMPRRACPA